MIVSIVCIAIHQIAFILSLTVWRGYTVYPAMFLRPAGLTDEAAAAAIAAAEAAPDIIRYWANSFVWLSFIIFAGTPPITVFDGTSFDTTAPAAIIAPSPIVTPGKIVECEPIQTLFPI